MTKKRKHRRAAPCVTPYPPPTKADLINLRSTCLIRMERGIADKQDEDAGVAAIMGAVLDYVLGGKYTPMVRGKIDAFSRSNLEDAGK